MRIFYVLSIILITSVQAKSQDRIPASTTQRDNTPVIRFYPNPATSIINFDFQKGYDRSFNFQIYNLLGKKVFEANNVNPKTTVNLTDFTPGVYMFQLRDAKGRVVELGKFQVSK